jgi:hypothetical protein
MAKLNNAVHTVRLIVSGDGFDSPCRSVSADSEVCLS